MPRIQKITASMLLKKYKKFLIGRIEEIDRTIFFNHFSNDLKENILLYFASKYPEEYKKGKLDTIERIKQSHSKEYNNYLFDKMKSELENEEEINTDENLKLLIFLVLYKNCKGEMSQEELEELKYMYLGKEKEYFILQERNGKNLVITKENQQKLGDIKDYKTRKLFEDVLFRIIMQQDLENIIKDKYSKEVFPYISGEILRDILIKQGVDIDKETVESISKYIEGDYLDEDTELQYTQKVKEFFNNEFQLLDKNNLLLCAAGRIILGIEMIKENKDIGMYFEEEEQKKYGMINSIQLLRDIYAELSKNIYHNGKEYTLTEDDQELIIVTKEKIGEFLQRCTDYEYLSDEDIKEIHEQILGGYLIEDEEKRKIVNICIEDMINLSGSYNMQEDKEIRKRILETSNELYKYLKETGQLDNKELLDLYLNGKINLPIMESIEDRLSEEEYNGIFKSMYRELKEIYGSEQKNERFKENKEKIIRFSKFYSEMMKNEEVNIDNLLTALIEEYGEDNAGEIVDALCNLNLVTLKKGVEDWIGTADWIGSSKMFEEERETRILPPVDIRELFDNENIQFNIEDIIKIIEDIKESSEKFMIIGAIFPDDEKNRSILLKRCLSIEEEVKRTDKTEGERKKRGRGDPKERTTIDPYDRIKLMTLLDKGYHFKMTPDGYAIVTLPELGKIIVEKMFSKNVEPSYGAATYVVDEKYFEQNIDRIMQDGKVNRKELINSKGTSSIKIIHDLKSWGRKIKENLGIEVGSNYSKEDIQKIDEAIENIEEHIRKQLGEKGD